jgi:dephospho-CoA kinase
MNKPLLVAITGGIGSGKTTVAKIFEKLGVPIYIADVHAKKVMSDDQELVNSIKNHFGSQSYNNGELNRAYLSKTVFENKSKLEQLNSIVHPAVRKDFKEWVKTQKHPYIIYESALIFEQNQQDNFDEIILVTAPEELRIKRVKERSNLSENDIKKRIHKQMPDNLKKESVKYIIENVKKDDLKDVVYRINNKIINKNIKNS